MYTSQLCVQGACKQSEIIKAFGVSKSSVLRSVNKYREEGIEGFYKPRRTRSASVMTPQVIQLAEQLFAKGNSKVEIARELNIPCDTLRKAIDQGRVTRPDSSSDHDDTGESSAGSATIATAAPRDKSARSNADRAAGEQMGVACTRPVERVLAAMGKLPGGASTKFESCRDVSCGGVLCALPALIENGLFRHLKNVFPTLTGYYTTLHVILLLACMALCRIRAVERLQYESPGELGRLMGLDRVPEVRCLRQKLGQLSSSQDDNAPDIRAALLSKDWMDDRPELAGTLDVDGHVRLYHGSKTELPRRYVSRQRLCLRGTTDYWVNDALGQPFFSVERPIDQGMLEAIENDVVPHLLRHVPNQPTREQLDADRYRSRFLMIFDREGYSPAFFRRMGGRTPHRLRHLPQVPQRGLADVGVLRCHRDDAQWRNGHHEAGRARFGDRCARQHMDARSSQADCQRPSDESDQHGLRPGRAAGCTGPVQSLVSGKLLPLHDGTLCH